MPSYKSPLKMVDGGEGDRCKYPLRLDTYGRGCANDCAYCYAKSLLDFRGLWHPDSPSSADINKIRNKIKNGIKRGDTVRLGGMTDCFQEAEKWHRVTYRTIKMLNKKGINYLIVTKNPLVARDDYLEVMDKELAHIQVSITSTDDELNKTYEKAEPYTERKAAIEKLYENGFDVQVRLSPFIPEFVDLDEIASIKCDKILVEFLRVNHWVEKSLKLDYSPYTHKEGNYKHLPLTKKKSLLAEIKGFKEISVCDDVASHYSYFAQNVNHNPEDCCNLRRNK